MRKYESPARNLDATESAFKTGRLRTQIGSLLAKSVRVFSIALGVYAPIGMLFAIMMFYAAMAGVRLAEDEFVERRRIYGAIAIGLVISGIVAVYGAYQLWNLASSLARSNRRRARELRERQVRS